MRSAIALCLAALALLLVPALAGRVAGIGAAGSTRTLLPTAPRAVVLLADAAATVAPRATSTPGAGSTFTLASAAVTEGGALPPEYTCDGGGATPPLAWSNPPAGTRSYAVTMWHVPPEGGTHWYWVLYNVPATITSLPRNAAAIGTLGGNSVDPSAGYSPPCSKGPGLKTYVLSVYALSEAPPLSGLPASDSAAVSRDGLLAANADRTLASADLHVTYAR